MQRKSDLVNIVKINNMAATYNLDFSTWTKEAIPKCIGVRLANGIVLTFEIPSFGTSSGSSSPEHTSHAEPSAPIKKWVKADHKQVMKPRKLLTDFDHAHDAPRYCMKNILCDYEKTTGKPCKYLHMSKEDYKHAIMEGSPDETHEFIEEIFTTPEFDDDHLQMVISSSFKPHFSVFQQPCDYGEDCHAPNCGFIHPDDEKALGALSIDAVKKIPFMKAKLTV